MAALKGKVSHSRTVGAELTVEQAAHLQKADLAALQLVVHLFSVEPCTVIVALYCHN